MAMAMETAHITPLDGERPAQYAERVGKGYAEASIQKDKKKGQFFTPLVISNSWEDRLIHQKKKRFQFWILVAD